METKYNFSACKVKKINEKMCGVIKPETPITPDYIAWFTEQLSDTILAQTPKVTVRYHNQKIPAYILRLIKIKKQLYREIRENSDPNLKRKFNALNKDIHKLIGNYRSHKYLEACKEIEDQKGKTY